MVNKHEWCVRCGIEPSGVGVEGCMPACKSNHTCPALPLHLHPHNRSKCQQIYHYTSVDFKPAPLPAPAPALPTPAPHTFAVRSSFQVSGEMPSPDTSMDLLLATPTTLMLERRRDCRVGAWGWEGEGGWGKGWERGCGV